MKKGKNSGLSGAVAVIAVTAVLVAGLASTAYINISSSNKLNQEMQEVMRQATLNQELLRIYVHSEDGSVDAPAYITLVNAWGFESRVLKALVIAKNNTVLRETDFNPPLRIQPGRQVRITPAILGLGYTSFRQLADNVAALIFYTEAGNRFGSTWGFPREDNLVGETTVTTASYATTEVWRIPTFTTLNRTVTIPTYTTLNPPRNATYASIYARIHLERITIYTHPYLPYVSITTDDVIQGLPPSPDIYSEKNVLGIVAIPYINWMNIQPYYGVDTPVGIGYEPRPSWFWAPQGGFRTFVGQPQTVERDTYYTVVNSPRRIVMTMTGENGYCVASWSLARVEITPLPPAGFPAPPQGSTTRRAVAVSLTHTNAPYIPDLQPSRIGSERAGPVFTVNTNIELQLYHMGMTVRFYTIRCDPYHYDPNSPSDCFRIWEFYPVTMRIPGTVTAATTLTGSHGATYLNGEWPYWRAVVTPLTFTLPSPHRVSAAHIVIGNAAEYVVDRYYYVDSVQCHTYQPSPPPGNYVDPCIQNPDLPACRSQPPPPPMCDVVGETVQEPSRTTPDNPGTQMGVIIVRWRVVCPPVLR